MEKILLAGATGYLGGYILDELIRRKYPTRIVVRNPEKLKATDRHSIEMINAELTKSLNLENCCEGIDVVISTVGITRQKDGLTYMDVDYQANMNLLEEAIKRMVTNSKFYGPVEFFMTVLSMDLIAPEYGNHTLNAYFGELKKANLK